MPMASASSVCVPKNLIASDVFICPDYAVLHTALQLPAKKYFQNVVMESIGQRIRRLRLERGLIRQKQLADLIGVNQSTISAIESKPVALTAENLYKIARALQVTPDLIMTGTEIDDMGSIELQRIYASLTLEQRDTLVRMARALMPQANDKAA
jgi:transcriptional regulator with XRE-family HTH domain